MCFWAYYMLCWFLFLGMAPGRCRPGIFLRFLAFFRIFWYFSVFLSEDFWQFLLIFQGFTEDLGANRTIFLSVVRFVLFLFCFGC